MITETHKSSKTNIQISIETKDRLVKIGSKNESYEDIISRILDEYENLHSAD